MWLYNHDDPSSIYFHKCIYFHKSIYIYHSELSFRALQKTTDTYWYHQQLWKILWIWPTSSFILSRELVVHTVERNSPKYQQLYITYCVPRTRCITMHPKKSKSQEQKTVEVRGHMNIIFKTSCRLLWIYLQAVSVLMYFWQYSGSVVCAVGRPHKKVWNSKPVTFQCNNACTSVSEPVALSCSIVLLQ